MLTQTITYPNSKRMLLAADKLMGSASMALVPVKGTVVQTAKGCRCPEGAVLLCAMPYSGGPALVLGNSAEAMNGFGAEKVEHILPFTKRDSFFAQLVALLQMKYEASENPFVLECASTGCTLRISSGEVKSGLTYEVLAPGGTTYTAAGTPVSTLVNDCKSVKSFSYEMKSDSCDKSVCVKRGQVEIYREIAHYLNRCIAFHEVNAAGLLVRTGYLSHNGCCEISVVKGSERVYKVPYTRFRISSDLYIGAADVTVDNLLRAGNLTRALEG